MSSLFSVFSEKSSLTGENENESCFPKLSFKERLIGFGLCCAFGWFISIMSFGSAFGIMTGSPEKFAISYSLGNFLTLLGNNLLN